VDLIGQPKTRIWT